MDYSYSLDEYAGLLDRLGNYSDLIPEDLISSFGNYWRLVDQFNLQNRFSKPMPWIGMYIATASLFCVLAMLADLLHGLRNRKLWFPCKYFTLNAASLTVIAIAMKLPVDLSNPMPSLIDQVSKLGSMAFMCTMMANLLPSLATMDGKELVTNMIALSLLVITLVVNICIQTKTTVINDVRYIQYVDDYTVSNYYLLKPIAAIYAGILLSLIIVHTCSSLAILKSKRMLELKYEHVCETTLKDQHPEISSVEKLKEHVSCYWIMAETGSPQFMIASCATTIASGVICALSTLLYTSLVVTTFSPLRKPHYGSSYEWSILYISIMQFIGVILGTIAPFSRCFMSMSFKLSTKLICNHSKVFKVENYWTQKLSDWKQCSVPSPFHSRKCNIVIENLKIILLNICIGFQKSVVVACKMIGLIPIFVVVCVWCCSCCWKWLKTMFSDLGIKLGKNPGAVEQNEDIHRYALQIQDDIELADSTLKGILKSLNRLIQRAEKKQPNNLMKLLEVSGDFKGVGKYDNHHVSRLTSEEYLDCWSLPLVNLTTIAISLPEIESNTVDWLLSSVSEGLVYVRLVEEILNATDEFVITRKAAKHLWRGIEFERKWHGIMLRQLHPQLNKVPQILQWFRDTARKMVDGVGSHIGYRDDNLIYRSVSAESMYRITETILLYYDNKTEEVSQRELHDQLLSMIADILAACLTNLPKAIMMRCHTSEIGKREANVRVAAQCLGETWQIIKSLEDRELPSLNPDEFPFIGKWCSYPSA